MGRPCHGSPLKGLLQERSYKERSYAAAGNNRRKFSVVMRAISARTSGLGVRAGAGERDREDLVRGARQGRRGKRALGRSGRQRLERSEEGVEARMLDQLVAFGCCEAEAWCTESLVPFAA